MPSKPPAKKASKKAAPKTKPVAVASKAEAPDEELYSISRLASFFEVDRSVLRKRLIGAGVKPIKDTPKEKLYRLEDAEAAMAQDTNENEIILRKLMAETQLKELDLERKTGEVVMRKEVEDYLQKLFTSLYQRIAVRFPREIGAALYKAESSTALIKELQTNLETIFHEIRTDHRRFLSSD